MTQADLFTSTPAPMRGNSPRAKHASFTGAVQSGKQWSEKQARILAAIAQRPLSRQELVLVIGLPINAICSLVADLVTHGVLEVAEGYDTQVWPDGSTTRRERFQVRR